MEERAEEERVVRPSTTHDEGTWQGWSGRWYTKVPPSRLVTPRRTDRCKARHGGSGAEVASGGGAGRYSAPRH